MSLWKSKADNVGIVHTVGHYKLYERRPDLMSEPFAAPKGFRCISGRKERRLTVDGPTKGQVSA